MHKDAAEMQAFLTRVKSKARSKDDNAGILAKEAMTKDVATIESNKGGLNEDTFNKANAKLYDCIIDMIDNNELTRTLGSSYDDRGAQALIYIRGCFAAGGNDDKVEVSNDKYQSTLQDINQVGHLEHGSTQALQRPASLARRPQGHQP